MTANGFDYDVIVIGSGFGSAFLGSCLQVDAELAQFDDRGPAPADRVG
jgi:hypothetical protein